MSEAQRLRALCFQLYEALILRSVLQAIEVFKVLQKPRSELALPATALRGVLMRICMTVSAHMQRNT